MARDIDNLSASEAEHAIWEAYERVHIAFDFMAALLFVVGSVMFLYQSLQTPAIWCFIVGSVFFFVKPAIKVARKIHLAERR